MNAHDKHAPAASTAASRRPAWCSYAHVYPVKNKAAFEASELLWSC